jgi:hypothetical protein
MLLPNLSQRPRSSCLNSKSIHTYPMEVSKAAVALGKVEIAETMLGFKLPKLPPRPIVKMVSSSYNGKGNSNKKRWFFWI